MNSIFYPKAILSVLLFIFCQPSMSIAQNGDCEAKTLEGFFECYGGEAAFSAHSIDAVSTFIRAEDAINAGDYTQAKSLIDNLFKMYPKGGNSWGRLWNAPNGANIGSPNAYYGLRMIEDIVNHKLNGDLEVEAKKATMKIVLVGCSEGVQPTTQSELENGTGQFVKNTTDPKLLANDYYIVRQAFDFFSTYVNAITKGQLELEIEIIELPDVCMPVDVSNSTPYIASGSIEPVWAVLSAEVKESTDWWWILYPSHVPEGPDFDDDAFITGGMGLDNKGGPAFIVDDQWIVRKPAHLAAGAGDYTEIERRIYLPQWFQHEFFHHLYRAYPELGLEVDGHDWFDRNFWPDDFEGQFETDFYSESLHKRLQVDCVALVNRLITRTNSEQKRPLYAALGMDELLGSYSIDNIKNPWQEGAIIQQNNKYYWKNKANVQWEVVPNFKDGTLVTGADSPYPGKDFSFELFQKPTGEYLPGVTALMYQGELYKKRFGFVRGNTPIEITLGTYQKVPNISALDVGDITKEAGQLYWNNNNGDQWRLEPDPIAESFSLGNDAPTPSESLQLIFSEDACSIFNLGFEYLGEYYWKPKRDLENPSPRLLTPLEDLELQESFGTYSIDLSSVFADPQGETIFHFASSSENTLISTDINNQQLVLSGGELGATTIFVMAIDANGGLVVDSFQVQVNSVVSNKNRPLLDQSISIFPNPTSDGVSIIGASTNYEIVLFSVDKSFRQKISLSGASQQIDLKHLVPGAYIIQIIDPQSGRTRAEKIIKY